MPFSRHPSLGPYIVDELDDIFLQNTKMVLQLTYLLGLSCTRVRKKAIQGCYDLKFRQPNV